MPTIQCLPSSLCSWNFIARNLPSGSAAINFDWFTEQGQIIGTKFKSDVQKHGLLSGHWTLEQGGKVIAEARKPSAMFRSFEISAPELHFTLAAKSPFTRAFEMTIGPKFVGQINPAHAFTRRATIQCSNAIPEHIQLFAFWLVVLIWRRSAQNSSS